MLDQKNLRSLFDYDETSGQLIHLPRPESCFSNTQSYRAWTTKYSGKPAGCIKKGRDGATAYKSIAVNGRRWMVHTVIWAWVYGETVEMLDHENGNGLDNRIGNLRPVSNAVNLKNQSLRSTNKSGVMGVRFAPKENKWRAEIGVAGKRISLGHFSEIEDAIAARKLAEQRFGFHPNHGRLKVAA